MRVSVIIACFAAAAIAAEAPRPYYDFAAILHGRDVVWSNPGRVDRRDLRYGIGGAKLAPRPPYLFLKEDTTGTNPKVRVRDGAQREWAVKFGPEVSPDTFCSRLVWAVGYYAEPTYYVARGRILGARRLKRARHYIDSEGGFAGARFQLRSKHPEFLSDIDWSWDENPFTGTHELNGLKIMMMLVSNWDDKDIRDAKTRGSNTAIYRQGDAYVFFVDDWGGAMGNWGHYFSRTKWDAVDFYRESRRFVRGVKDGRVEWGYKGQHTSAMTRDITPSDVRWLLRYLGRITDRQLRIGLLASGATDDQARFYTRALRMRIRALQTVVNYRARSQVAAR